MHLSVKRDSHCKIYYCNNYNDLKYVHNTPLNSKYVL